MTRLSAAAAAADDARCLLADHMEAELKSRDSSQLQRARTYLNLAVTLMTLAETLENNT
jgi:hypothetical protein